MGVLVVVGTQKGALLLRADDARERFAHDGLSLTGWLVTAAASDASGRLYVGVTHDVWGTAVMASDDGGRSFEQLPGELRYRPEQTGNEEHNRILGAMDPMGQRKGSGRFVDQIWKLHAVGDTLYAGVSEAGLFRSDDRGKSWQVARGLDEHPDRESWGPGFGGLCAHTVLVDERDPQRIWVGISSAGFFRSDDGGETFVRKDEGVPGDADGCCVHSVAHDPNEARVLYRQDHRGLFRSDDAGDSWRNIENGVPATCVEGDRRFVFGFAIALDPASGSAFAIPMEDASRRYPADGQMAVYRTQDGGASWTRLTRGLPADCYGNVLRGALSLDSLDPCGVYFGTTGGEVFAGSDRGESFKRIPGTWPKVLCVEAFED
jgi:photosystem II stability/assembly factor-like uncharacterized protein